jgi:hypothetical protein
MTSAVKVKSGFRLAKLDLPRTNEWRRAYDEINTFAKMLVADGACLANSALSNLATMSS